jgi:hypothetical protein
MPDLSPLTWLDKFGRRNREPCEGLALQKEKAVTPLKGL